MTSRSYLDGVFFSSLYTSPIRLAPTSPVITTAVTDALGNQTTYRFNIQGCLPTSRMRWARRRAYAKSRHQRDSSGDRSRAVCRLRTAGHRTVSHTYDSKGNTLTTTDALGNTTTYTYDPVFNQVTSITDPSDTRHVRLTMVRAT